MQELVEEIGEELLEDDDEQVEAGDQMLTMEEEEPNDCEECGADLTEKKLMKKIGGTEYCFCSQSCITNFLAHFG